MFARKYRIHAFLILTAVAIIYVSYRNNQPDQNMVAAADAAAVEFMQMVDAGKYDDSWVIAAPYLQNNIAQEKWLQELTSLRTRVGSLKERVLEDASYTAEIKEMPESVLIMLEYASSFERQQVKEVVTVIQGSDNRWRVVGYFLQ